MREASKNLLTVGQLKKWLSNFPEDAACWGYEGEVAGIVVDFSQGEKPDFYISNDGQVEEIPYLMAASKKMQHPNVFRTTQRCEILLDFCSEKISRKQAMQKLDVSYFELINLIAEAGLELPTLPDQEIEKMAQNMNNVLMVAKLEHPNVLRAKFSGFPVVAQGQELELLVDGDKLILSPVRVGAGDEELFSEEHDAYYDSLYQNLAKK